MLAACCLDAGTRQYLALLLDKFVLPTRCAVFCTNVNDHALLCDNHMIPSQTLKGWGVGAECFAPNSGPHVVSTALRFNQFSHINPFPPEMLQFFAICPLTSPLDQLRSTTRLNTLWLYALAGYSCRASHLSPAFCPSRVLILNLSLVSFICPEMCMS